MSTIESGIIMLSVAERDFLGGERKASISVNISCNTMTRGGATTLGWLKGHASLGLVLSLEFVSSLSFHFSCLCSSISSCFSFFPSHDTALVR